jgi:MFS family permease
VFGAAALAQTLTGRLEVRAPRLVGLIAEAVGVVVLAISMHAANLGAFVVAGIVVGVGAGVLFKSSVGAVAAMASPAKRSEALAGLFLISYLGLAAPVIGIGIAAHYTTETTVMRGSRGSCSRCSPALVCWPAAPVRRRARERVGERSR